MSAQDTQHGGPSVEQLDTRIDVITPENIAFRYRVAGPFRRLPAYLIDLLIRAVIAAVALIGLSIVFGFVGVANMGVGLGLICAFVLSWFYGGVFEALWNGQTPGKRLMGLRVLSTDGKAIDAVQATLRNVLRLVDGIPLLIFLFQWCVFGLIVATMKYGFQLFGCCVLDFVTASMNDRFQRLGDLACGTMVVVESRPGSRDVPRIDDPEAVRLAADIPASFVPSRTLGRALATYVGRRWAFSPGRRQHIAAHLARPLAERLGFPPDVDPDRLLCAVYHRTFITDRENEPADSRPSTIDRRRSRWGEAVAASPPGALDLLHSVRTGRPA